MLDYARATVHAKCAGITEQDARRAPLPGSPLTTISGLVSHLRWVEYGWFEVNLLGAEYHGPARRRTPAPDRTGSRSPRGRRRPAAGQPRASAVGESRRRSPPQQ
jgi:hypothetical protein